MAGWVTSGWVTSGWIEEAAPAPPQEEVDLGLGEPGDASHRLPFNALGGSVIDLDLLYGLLGSQATQEDIQPIFAFGSREDLIRCYAKEVPRQAIRDAVSEAHATLIDVDDIVIEGSPMGANLFGSVGLTTRPTFGVRLDNSDGNWNLLMLRELVMYSPAGIFVDIGHAVIAPVLTGTISAIRYEGSDVVVTGGFSARAHGSLMPSLTPNLDKQLPLRTAGEYANPLDATAILPEVFDDWLSPNVGAADSNAVATPCVCIDQVNMVFCANARPTASAAPIVMWNGVIQDPSTYAWNPADNYEGKGLIATLTFTLKRAKTGLISVRHGGSVDASGSPIRNPFLMVYWMLSERAGWTIDSFDRGSCQQTTADLDALGYPAYWCFNEQKSIRDWLLEIFAAYHTDVTETGNGQLAVIFDRTLSTLPVVPDYHIPSYEIEDHGQPATAISLEMQGDDVVNQVTLHGRYNWSTNEVTTDYTWDYVQSQSAYQASYPAELTFRGMYTLQHAIPWLNSFVMRHGFDPTTVSLTMKGLKGLPLIPPRLVTVEWPPFNWQQHLLKIRKTTFSFRNRRISLECVDCQRELADAIDSPFASPSQRLKQLSHVYEFVPGTVGNQGNLLDAPVDPRNEAANGDFEEGDNGQWHLKHLLTGTPQWTIVENATEARHGRFYAKHILGAGNGSIFTLRHRVDPGEWIVASAWFRQHVGGSNGQAVVQVVVTDRNGVILDQPFGNPVDPWTIYVESVLFTQAPQNAYYYQAGIGFRTLCTTGQWRADHVFAVSGSQTEVVAARQGSFTSRNFVINGDFELGQVMWNLGRVWNVSSNPGFTPHSGIWFAAHNGEAFPTGEDRLTSLALMGVTQGQTFTFQAYGRTVNNPNGTARLGVTWMDGMGNVLSENASAAQAGPLVIWTLASGSMAVPPNALYARVWVGITNHTVSGTWWLVDDCFVFT